MPETVQGKRLNPVLLGTVKSIHPHVFCYFRSFQRMVRTDRYKLIHYPRIGRYQLFDLQTDPHELKDLSTDPQFTKTTTRLKKTLLDWQREMKDPALETGK